MGCSLPHAITVRQGGKRSFSPSRPSGYAGTKSPRIIRKRRFLIKRFRTSIVLYKWFKMQRTFEQGKIMASPPVLEDSNHMTSRAKTRIGVAVVLLAVAIGGLALLSKRTPETQLEEQPLQKQESLSSGEDTTAAPAAPETSPQISSAQQEPPPPMPVPETPVTPPPPPPPAPVVSKLPPEPQKSAAPG